MAPRLGFAWAPGSSKNGRQKTVIRGGFGIFYDRVPDSVIENTYLLNGTNQLSYTVTDPILFPMSRRSHRSAPAQNSIYRLDPDLRADYSLQSAIGVERQLPRNTTMAVTYTNTRALHLEQTVPINTPLPGTYIPGKWAAACCPMATAGNLFEYESGGLMKQNILMANFNTRFSRNVSLFGNYSYNRSNDSAHHAVGSLRFPFGLGAFLPGAPPPLPVGGLGGGSARFAAQPLRNIAVRRPL